ncbi:MAG TPA: peptidoglycan-associated lipoprotein Pal [Candidatus Sulfotelmatobacter sp.]|nr:peptidoglycan-associated lipoprotein Pal [Candidatus Sulfotelmatobacter sp.]
MNERKSKWIMLALVMGAIIALGACKKKVAPPPPPPPPAPAAPTASLTVTPNVIERGQSATLAWDTKNATDVAIDSIGSVSPSGSENVTPGESTTYRLTAKGPGGSEIASARITVNVPPPPPPAEAPAPNLEELFSKNIKNIFFDFDRYDIRSDQQGAIAEDAKFLSEHPSVSFTIEGHCDDRGSIEYNLALGDKRANRVKQALVDSGVSSDRIRTVTYGKERPFCTEHNEQCWQENRQGHFVYQK